MQSIIHLVAWDFGKRLIGKKINKMVNLSSKLSTSSTNLN